MKYTQSKNTKYDLVYKAFFEQKKPLFGKFLAMEILGGGFQWE